MVRKLKNNSFLKIVPWERQIVLGPFRVWFRGFPGGLKSVGPVQFECGEFSIFGQNRTDDVITFCKNHAIKFFRPIQILPKHIF